MNSFKVTSRTKQKTFKPRKQNGFCFHCLLESTTSEQKQSGNDPPKRYFVSKMNTSNLSQKAYAY